MKWKMPISCMSLFFLFAMSSSLAQKGIANFNAKETTNIQAMLIDDFEEEGAWKLTLSQFRAYNWEDDPKKGRDQENQWIKWISKNEHPDKLIIPPSAILKNRSMQQSNEKDKETISENNKILALKARWAIPALNTITIEPTTIRPAIQHSPEFLSLITQRGSYKPARSPFGPNYHSKFIWLPRNCQSLRLQIWSGNYTATLAGVLEDYRGNQHNISFGNMNFKGWKIMTAKIPTTLLQSKPNNPEMQPLKFLKFIIQTKSNIEMDEFFTYFDQLYATADIQSNFYNIGNDLRFFDQIWGESKTSNINKK